MSKQYGILLADYSRGRRVFVSDMTRLIDLEFGNIENFVTTNNPNYALGLTKHVAEVAANIIKLKQCANRYIEYNTVLVISIDRLVGN